jgi:hypothetical protein
MALLAVIGGLLLAAALFVREIYLSKERALQGEAFSRLRDALKDAHTRHRRLAEDLLVLQRLLEEKRLIDAEDLISARLRLIDHPRRIAAERNALASAHNLSPTQLVIDEDANKIH